MPSISLKSKGGCRPGAGRPYKWKHGTTKLIRVPRILAAEVLAYACDLDNNGGFPRARLVYAQELKADSQLVRENKHLREMISLIYSHHEREEMLRNMRVRFNTIITGRDEFGNPVEFDDRFGAGCASEDDL